MIYSFLWYFVMYSFIGWISEVAYAAVVEHRFVNRGFLNGPVCPIYGFGMIIVLFTLSPLADNLLLLYIGGVILPSVLELVGGWVLYKLYRTRWWDYSDFPFNIGGYICLEFSLLWGVGTVVVMKAVHPVIAGFVEMVPQMVGFVLMCILYACYAADVVVTAFAASDLARELDALEKVADSMHAVSDAMTELLGTTAMDVDQKMDESRLQLKLAAAEARDNAAKLSPRDAAAALRGVSRRIRAVEAVEYTSQAFPFYFGCRRVEYRKMYHFVLLDQIQGNGPPVRRVFQRVVQQDGHQLLDRLVVAVKGQHRLNVADKLFALLNGQCAKRVGSLGNHLGQGKVDFLHGVPRFFHAR